MRKPVQIQAIKAEMQKSAEIILMIGFTSIVVLYFVETIFSQSFSIALSYIFIQWPPEILFLNLSLIILFELVFYLFWRNVGVSFGITSVIACVLTIVNELKMEARGEAFTFNDIAVAREALLVAGNYDLKLSGIDLQVALLTIVLTALLIFFRRPVGRKAMDKKGAVLRGVTGLLCIGALAVLCGNMRGIMNLYKEGNGYIYVTSQYYQENGFLVGFVRTMENSIQEPEYYSEGMIEDIGNDIQGAEGSGDVPNVIFVMNESLYDISVLDEVKLSRDPLEGLRELQEEHTYGNFITPSYGGGTCNVEFEVLTGCPMEELAVGVMPYSDMIHHPIDSLASLMDERGYYTVAMHPNTGTYFNRRNIYRYMGFQEVFFTEEMGELPTEGEYASDLELYKRLIKLYEEKEQENMPFFAYVITMQNHGGYEYEYNGSGIEVLDPGKCGNEVALCTYANLVASSIDAFRYLVDYFETVGQPTVIVMFGDHSPNAVGSFGYEEEIRQEIAMMPVYRATPLVVYSNYGLPYEKWAYINGYSLASKVLDYCGITMDGFWAYGLEEANVPKLWGHYYIDQEWVAEANAGSHYKEYRKKMWMLVYDRIFGRNYYGNLKNF